MAMILAFFVLVVQLTAAQLNCVNSGLDGGCLAGGLANNAVQSAISQFSNNSYYGGGTTDLDVISVANADGFVAEITYSCTGSTNGGGGLPPPESVPPLMNGADLLSIAQELSGCPNQCGSYQFDNGCGLLLISGPGSNDVIYPDGECCVQMPTIVDVANNLETMLEIFNTVQNLADQWQDLLVVSTKRWFWDRTPADGQIKRRDGSASGLQLSIGNLFNRLERQQTNNEEWIPLLAREGEEVRATSTLLELGVEILIANGVQVAAQNQQANFNAGQSLRTLGRSISTVAATDRAAVAAALGGAAGLAVIVAAFSGLFSLFHSAHSSGSGGGGVQTVTVTVGGGGGSGGGGVVTVITVGGGGGVALSTLTPSATTTTTTSTSSASICDVCDAINSALSQPTPYTSQPQKRFEHDELNDTDPNALIGTKTDFSTYSVRGLLQKRSGRIYNSAKLGNYGVSNRFTQPDVSMCPSNVFSWHALKYPSTMHPPNLADLPAIGGEENTDDNTDDATAVTSTSAPNVPTIGMLAGGPFIDVKIQFESDPDDPLIIRQCGGHLAGFPDYFHGTQDDPLYVIAGGTPNQNYYDTEHVFELHMIKDWFFWLTDNQFLSCDALQKIFGTSDGVNTDANRIMAQLAWYDPVLNQGTPGELFVLNRGLNHLKGMLMNGRPIAEVEALHNVIIRPVTTMGNARMWGDCQGYLFFMQMVFQFLNEPLVETAFTNAAARVQSFLGDGTRFLGINEAPQGHTFAGLWVQWLTLWMCKRQNDVLIWRNELQTTCSTAAPQQSCWSQNYDQLFLLTYPVSGYNFPASWFLGTCP